MSYNAKNYTEQGGEKTVIGGTLEILEGASVTGLPAVSAASASAVGGVKAAEKGAGDTVEAKIGADGKLYVPAYPQAANQADSTATTVAGLKDDFNACLAKLKAAGLMTADTPAEEPGGDT